MTPAIFTDELELHIEGSNSVLVQDSHYTSDGYIYVAGITSGNLDDQINTYLWRPFLSRYSANGEHQWTRLAPEEEDHGTGYYGHESNIIAGSDGLVYLASGGKLLAYSNNGELVSTIQPTASYHHGESSGIEISTNSNIFISGSRKYTSNNEDQELVLVKIEDNGQGRITRSILGPSLADWRNPSQLEQRQIVVNGAVKTIYSLTQDDEETVWIDGDESASYVATALTSDIFGCIYVTGRYWTNRPYPYSNQQFFLAKYTTEGDLEWLRRENGTGNGELASNAICTDGEYLYVTGRTSELLGDFSRGRDDAFVAKYSLDGIVQWTKQLGSNSHDSGLSIQVSDSGCLAITGVSGDDGTELNGVEQAPGAKNRFIVLMNSIDGEIIHTGFYGEMPWSNYHSSTLFEDGRFLFAGSTINQEEQSGRKQVGFLSVISLPILNNAPMNITLSKYQFTEEIKAGSVVATLSSVDQDDNDTHTYELIAGEGDFDNKAFSIKGNQLNIIDSPDFETKDSYSIRLQTKDSGGLTFEKAFTLNVNGLQELIVNISVQSGLTGKKGGQIQIPIQIDDSSGVESIDLKIAYDQNIFEIPSSNIFEPGELNPGWSFTANASVPGSLTLSAFSETELGFNSGSIAVLNLKIKDDATLGASLVDIVTSEVNENRIKSSIADGEVLIEKSSFQVLDIRTHSHGLSLALTDAPDMDVFRLYGGKESVSQKTSLVLTNSNDDAISLSAHWEEETNQLHLLSIDVLQDGDYTLQIRSDGLVSVTGDLLDGNGDGISGDDLVKQISHSTPYHYVSVGDTARSAGQDLSINGSSLNDSITGIPIHLSTTADLNSLTGEISFDSSFLKGVALEKGLDLPDDWIINYSESSPGLLTYTVSGQTSITGNLQDSLRFVGQVNSSASISYGSTSLIQARVIDSSDGQIPFKSDPGLLVNAYSGDSTGNGTHSSLDASRVQRVVVGLDTGFDAYDDIDPILIGDTTGNGSLSSLDASRIQQQVVGLPVDSFPGIPLV